MFLMSMASNSSSIRHIRRMGRKLVVKILGLEKVPQRRQEVMATTIIRRLCQVDKAGQVLEKPRWMWLCLR